MDRETTLQAVNKSGMPRMTSHTITDMAVLEDEFAKIRQQGYGTDHEESIKGACCLAASVRDHTGAVVASIISASLMTDRFFRNNESRLASVVKSAAAELSASIDYEAKSIGNLRAPVRRGITIRG
jgi:DNA-binding IclR family transcriptional regulator